MTIDLSKARVGDTVKFRCGGEAVIAKEIQSQGVNQWVSLIGAAFPASWTHQGKWSTGEDHIFDIISITPKPFDWKDVKAGHGFMLTYAEERDVPVTFVAWSSYTEGDALDPSRKLAIVEYKNGRKSMDTNETVDTTARQYLTRAPEHDIQP